MFIVLEYFLEFIYNGYGKLRRKGQIKKWEIKMNYFRK